jgi:predicted nuclease of predicted toxin-antitoxin system
MKLLFDENLPPKLAGSLAEQFPGSAHLRKFGLVGATDEAVWEHAKEKGFTIVPKDSDFQQRSMLFGHPPKVVWLRIGNCTRDQLHQLHQLHQLITSHEAQLRQFDEGPFESLLVIY